MYPIPGRLWAWLSDVAMRRSERGGLTTLRRDIVGQAAGRTLEIGAGTGANLAHYPADVTLLVVTEPDAHKLRRLRRRAQRVRPDAQSLSAVAESLPFADAEFDTVVMTLVLCSVSNQHAALVEVRRVLRPGGTILFLEHVRADDPQVAHRQDRWRPVWRAITGGCEPNRETVAAIGAAGFALSEIRTERLPAAPAIVRPLAIGAATRTT